MRKACGLRQEVSHLDLGIFARLDMTVQLDDIVLIYQRGTVGLLALDSTYPACGTRRSTPEFGRRLEIEPPARACDRSLVSNAIKEAPDESGISGDIAQQSFALPPAHTGDNGFFQFGTSINSPVCP